MFLNPSSIFLQRRSHFNMNFNMNSKKSSEVKKYFHLEIRVLKTEFGSLRFVSTSWQSQMHFQTVQKIFRMHECLIWKFYYKFTCQEYIYKYANSQLVSKQMNTLVPGAIWAILMIENWKILSISWNV